MQGQREHPSNEHPGHLPAKAGWGAVMQRASRRFMTLVMRALQACLAAFVPGRCVACDGRSEGEPLCRTCADTLEEAPEDAAAPAPFAYGGALAEAVRRAKFRPDERPARALAAMFASAVNERLEDVTEGAQTVAWVPLHPRRLRTRGFDLASLLAHAVAKALRLPCEALLGCERYDPPLSRGADVEERTRRVVGRYTVTADVMGRRILLIDDVVTSGATLAEATRVLLDAGALEVVPLALAATPAWAPRPRRSATTTGGPVQRGRASPVQSFPRSMRPHMRKSARSDQSG